MRILMVGAGGVGDAAARIAARRSFFEALVVTDYDLARAERTVAAVRERHPGEQRFTADRVDASTRAAVAEAARRHRATHVLNAVDPRFVMPVFEGARQAGRGLPRTWPMSLVPPAPRPTPLTSRPRPAGRRTAGAARRVGRRRAAGAGGDRRPSPGCRTSSRATPWTDLFSHVTELGVRDGANLTVAGYDFAPGFSIWTTIEECLNPPVVYERDRGWYTTAPFSEPETFDFPGGIGPVECVNVEHEEVLLMPRWLDADR